MVTMSVKGVSSVVGMTVSLTESETYRPYSAES